MPVEFPDISVAVEDILSGFGFFSVEVEVWGAVGLYSYTLAFKRYFGVGFEDTLGSIFFPGAKSEVRNLPEARNEHSDDRC